MSLAHSEGLNYTCKGVLLDKEKKVLTKYSGNCYGGMLGGRVQDLLSQASWFDFYWVDRVSEHYGNTKLANEAFKYIRETGIMRFATIKRISYEDMQHKVFDGYSNYFRLRINVRRIKPTEAFLVGCIMRTFTVSPQIIDNFVKLCRLHGNEIDKSLLFLMAYKVTWNASLKTNMPEGHSVIPWTFDKLSGVTFKKFLDLASGQKPFYKSETYGDIQLHTTFNSVVGENPYGAPRYSRSLTLVKYSPDVVKTLIQEETV